MVLLAAIIPMVMVVVMIPKLNSSNAQLVCFHLFGTKTSLHHPRIRVAAVLNTLSLVLVFLRVPMLLQMSREYKNSLNRQLLTANTMPATVAAVASHIASCLKPNQSLFLWQPTTLILV